MIWGPRLLPSDWLFRVVPLHLAQNKGSDKVWISYYWFMVRSVDHVMSTMLKFLDPRSHGPVLTAKEVGRHSLLVYLGWGRNGTGEQRASLCPTPGDKILRAGCQVRWLTYHCSLPQIAQIQACPIHMRHWHSDIKGRADLGHEFATAGFWFFK